ncbi:RNA polymerase sigma-54 factor [Altererythrobacter atlanticus]|uniref:RNA polymerase sigma-54 factor n=1 Tax=Croceibacterium atlanticum TaxID=1267766 RepID=A0A0F7KXT9_9SPHN|nr:RNA polymerase factor sigma-54 [Croceibacterium atlanticum]AKH43630.1 RNA polymerase sigma-54 factor 1 [Croceibacterium atlanticum]MBB5733886.1 RNA polymerase sigma-54 factor [Croceibacterium atlanticum]
MALGPRLDLRQSQSLVMTPQLQQAIKLLALSNLEIETFISDALDNNPLLEAGELSQERGEEGPAADTTPADPTSVELMMRGAGEADSPLDIDPAALDRDRDTGDWSAQSYSGSGEDLPDIDERGDDEPTLAEHLEAQIGAATRDPQCAFITRHLVGQLDEAGYLTVSLREVSQNLGVLPDKVEEALALLQSLDPTGVGARSLSECLALQAMEADRYDPCMERLLDNLDLVARGSFPQLKRLCQVDDEDLADMLDELRSYDPKPGLRFGSAERAPVVPDILIAPGKAGGWDIALNQATLPRLIVNRGYYVELRGGRADKATKSWLGEKLADANWLVKALDQRQKTILKVASEIVKLQQGFFERGVSALKPLTLRAVAEAIDMHESTVSRVTSNKYLNCPRGTFELKYFFTSGVAAADGEGSVSAETVKAQIRALVDAEDPKAILSDDKLVELLKEKGFDLARRTVAKYREAIGIGSSVQRRRQKKLARIA